MLSRLTPVALLLCAFASPAWAQFKENQPNDAKGAGLGQGTVQKWQFGLTVTAKEGPCSGISGYVPVPVNWPEQQVGAVNEEISPSARVRYEMADNGVRLMLIDIPQLPAGQQAKAIITYEIEKRVQKAPEDTSVYKLPNSQRIPRDVRLWLAPTPLIEANTPKIKAALKEAAADKEKPWDKVEALYDWTRGKCKFKKGPAKGAVALLRDGEGDAEDATALFIALCRTADIPARTVWVPGHCYAEFYLEDDEGKGHWFPCELTGNRSFGGITDPRPIVEKGDSFRPPYNRRDKQRFLSEYLTASGTGRPTAKFIRSPGQ